MSWTKLQIINKALGRIGLANYNFDLQPEQLQSVCGSLEAMILQWNGKGIRLGYNASSDPDLADLDADSGLPDYAISAVYENLAIQIAPDFGKQPAQSLIVSAKAGMNIVTARSTQPVPINFPSMPSGAGNKTFRTNSPFTNPPGNNIDLGNDDVLDISGSTT